MIAEVDSFSECSRPLSRSPPAVTVPAQENIASCGSNELVRDFIYSSKQPILMAMLDKQRMHKVFKTIDTDGNGVIDRSDTSRWTRRCLPDATHSS